MISCQTQLLVIVFVIGIELCSSSLTDKLQNKMSLWKFHLSPFSLPQALTMLRDELVEDSSSIVYVASDRWRIEYVAGFVETTQFQVEALSACFVFRHASVEIVRFGERGMATQTSSSCICRPCFRPVPNHRFALPDINSRRCWCFYPWVIVLSCDYVLFFCFRLFRFFLILFLMSLIWSLHFTYCPATTPETSSQCVDDCLWIHGRCCSQLSWDAT